MYRDFFTIDAVGHGYDFSLRNRAESFPEEMYGMMSDFLYAIGHSPCESLEPGYMMTQTEFSCGFSGEELAATYFEESDLDMVAYHNVAISGYFAYGPSPWEVGVALKKAAPSRVLLYAAADPFLPPAEGLEDMERKAAEADIAGFKFYPSNGLVDPERHRSVSVDFSDADRVFPYFEKARELGVKHIAIHKAVPVGPGSLDKDRPDDVSAAALAFPDMTFEVVHAGWAFLEDCALQLMMHPNIYANLEGVSNFVVRQPRRFAQALGTLMMYAGADRILHGTGAAACHPQPVIEAIADFAMPQDMLDQGLPDVTDEIKRALLGTNMARLHGLDLAALSAEFAEDEWARRRKEFVASGAKPWRAHRAAHAGLAGVGSPQ